ncbi:peptidyl-prolyl cis-trans isomerase [Aeoliella mucimassa]|uniref:peptidylprolyl isomerase n=1 Tax=Aeoliella mucimassa TaxID=2527972 RepID=A0A518AGT2_9BACT|nr:peptidyl-prolyl cis-trans isomerase [Aeoliella mucimassa]QDU53927.1 Foldase protein PrsA 2 precursor [Aeoliella mucimassa]
MARPTRNDSVDPSASRTRRWPWMLASTVLVLGVALATRYFGTTAEAEAAAPARTSSQVKQASAQEPAYQPPEHDVMAIVNGEDINRRDLERACAERYGEDVLESMVNKKLIQHHCKKRGITITQQEVEDEVERMAKRFKLSREHWLELLANERGITEQEYKRDILWPTIALRKLVATELTVSDTELRQEYEKQYGASVRARIIVVGNQARAQQLHQQLTANPDDFARLAMSDSIDVNSASIGGLIQPIRQHIGDPGIERAAFSLQPGQISNIIPVGNQFAILKCEGINPPRGVDFAAVRPELEELIRDGKLREEAANRFAEYQKVATVQNVLNDPQLSKQMPDVVALVNGDKITVSELGKEAMTRHGQDVLSVEIGHKLLEQALKAAGKTVTQQDLNAEIAHAAKLAGVVDDQGNADVQEWVKTTTEEQGVTYKNYLRDSVWPSAALKKLTSGQVQVTEDDLRKGYEANYGERVRCRAVVLADMRRAQEVWEKARANPTLDYFGELAEQYSIEPTSKALRGEVPPIRLHGGQPQLEQVAFDMKPGDPPRILQLGDKYVVLKFEERTKPQNIEFAAVRDILMQDIFEKKLRLAMAKRYDEIYSSARIDNYLAGTTQAPNPTKQQAAAASAALRRDTAVRPTAGQR